MYKKLLLTIALLTSAVSAYASEQSEKDRKSGIPSAITIGNERIDISGLPLNMQQELYAQSQEAHAKSLALVQSMNRKNGKEKDNKEEDEKNKNTSSASASSGAPSHITLESMGMIDLSVLDPETKAQLIAQWEQEQASLALVRQLSGNHAVIKGKSELEEKDSDMAQRLANEERAHRLLQLQMEEEATRGYLAALSIQAEDSGTHHPQLLANEKLREAYAAYTKAFAAYKEINDQEQDKKKKDDVHIFNAAMNFKVLLPLLTAQDTISKADTALDTIIAELAAACKEIDEKLLEGKGGLTENLATLKGHITTNAVEASETGANVLHLLSRVWSLTKGDKGATRSLIQTLCDNSQTDGGCYPGHAGRLAQLYVAFLRQKFANL